MAHDDEFDTIVLSDDYSDFQDTVVDQVIAFDPALFQQAQAQKQQAAKADNGSRPMQAHVQQRTAPLSQSSAEEGTWVLGPQPSQPSQPTQPSQPASRAQSQPQPQAQPQAQPQQQPQPQPQAARTRAHGQTYAQAPSAYAATRAPMSQQAVPRTTPTMMAATDSAPDKVNPIIIGAIVGLAVVGIIAIIVAIAFAVAPSESSKSISNAPAIVVAPSSSAAGASASDEAIEPEPKAEPEPETENQTNGSYKQGLGSSEVVTNENGRALSEADAYEQLSKLYSLAAEYDSSVRSCADDFNNNFLKEDKAVREAKASTVSTLKVRIKSSWDEAKRVKVPMMSKNLEAYRDICELYECLYRRIDVMDQAWKIDLQYEKPKEHEAEIVAPLRAQQANGNDRYYTRFKELYPTVNLVKP